MSKSDYVMSTFLPLFTISVEHGFFSNGACHCLNFVATEKTQQIINNAGLLLRKTNDGIFIAYDESRLEALQQYAQDLEDDFCLEFKVYSDSAEFKNYSEPFAASNNDMLYLSNEKAETGEEGRVKLHAQEYVSKINFVPQDSAKLKDMLSQKDRLIAPVFVVKIGVDEKQNSFFDEQLKPTARHYYLRFKARQTFWKYFLLGDMAKQSFYISDPDHRVEFEPAGQAVLADQRVAMTFRSKQSIPLNENYDFHFQLKEKGQGRDKVLIKRLPVARMNQTGKEVVAEQGMVVSEIYINS